MTEEHIPVSEMPEYRELFEQHERTMERYRQERARKRQEERATAEAAGKVFARLDPDASDDELLAFLFRVSEASSHGGTAAGAEADGDTTEGQEEGDASSGADGDLPTDGAGPATR